MPSTQKSAFYGPKMVFRILNVYSFFETALFAMFAETSRGIALLVFKLLQKCIAILYEYAIFAT